MTTLAPSARRLKRRTAPPLADKLRKARLERHDNVLWSLSPEGLVLHHLDSGAYLELDKLGYWAWCFLDGARTVGEILDKRPDTDGEKAGAGIEKLALIIETLRDNGFIVERRHEQ